MRLSVPEPEKRGARQCKWKPNQKWTRCAAVIVSPVESTLLHKMMGRDGMPDGRMYLHYGAGCSRTLS